MRPMEQATTHGGRATARTRLQRGRALSERAVAAARRVVRSPDWPVVAALVLTGGALAEVRLFPGRASASNDSIDLVLAVLSTAPLALARRSLPAAAAIVSVVNLDIFASGSVWTVSGLLAQAAVLYLVAVRYGRVGAVLAGLACSAYAVFPLGAIRISGLALVMVLVVVFAILVLGDAARTRGRAIAERDASIRAMTDAEQDRAVIQERARIARELHDVVAHHVSMIAVQAETARLTTPGLPEQGQERLRAIGATAREAMAEMRRMLSLLREDEDGGAADRSPQPGLERLDDLVDGASAAGTRVRLTVTGVPRPLAPGVDLSAYRVLQEALTNVRRHAPGAGVDVELRYEDSVLRLRVRDDGPGPAGDGAGGHGLLGMRERVAMTGGRLRAGPAAGGGFEVEAELPLGSPSS